MRDLMCSGVCSYSTSRDSSAFWLAQLKFQVLLAAVHVVCLAHVIWGYVEVSLLDDFEETELIIVLIPMSIVLFINNMMILVVATHY